MSCPNRPKFGHAREGLCPVWAYKRKMAPVLKLHSLVCPRFYWAETKHNRVGQPGVGRMELVDLP